MAGFLVLVLGVDLAIHFYLCKRFVLDPLVPGWGRRAGVALFAGLAVVVPVTVVGARGRELRWLAWPGYLWIGLMFYLFVALLVLEVPRRALMLLWRPASRTSEAGEPPAVTGTLSRRQVIARGVAVAAGVAAAGTTAYGVRTALGPPRLQRVEMPLAKLPRTLDGIRLAVVSDIHLGPLTGSHHVGRIVDLINSVTADIVCVVGDLVDGSVAELGRFAEPLRNLQSRRGAYFVTGNHEYYSGFAPWIEEVAGLGVRPLRNERVEIGGLDLAGVNDLGGARYGDGPDFGRALGDRDSGRPVVLMAHQPLVARYAAPFGVDLQVSGHTHGGQMAPFNLLVKLQQPVVSGFGRVDGVPVFVTDGAGFWGPPVRVGAPPQVSVIDLRAE